MNMVKSFKITAALIALLGLSPEALTAHGGWGAGLGIGLGTGFLFGGMAAAAASRDRDVYIIEESQPTSEEPIRGEQRKFVEGDVKTGGEQDTAGSDDEDKIIYGEQPEYSEEKVAPGDDQESVGNDSSDDNKEDETGDNDDDNKNIPGEDVAAVEEVTEA